MTTLDIIPNTKDPDSRVYLLSELIAELTQLLQVEGDIPVVGRGYEMGMDNLEPPTVVKLYRGYEGVCGTYSDSNNKDDEGQGIKAVTLGNAG